MPPAGWYEKPGSPDILQYWDGENWTDHYNQHPLAEFRRKTATKAAEKANKAEAKVTKSENKRALKASSKAGKIEISNQKAASKAEKEAQDAIDLAAKQKIKEAEDAQHAIDMAAKRKNAEAEDAQAAIEKLRRKEESQRLAAAAKAEKARLAAAAQAKVNAKHEFVFSRATIAGNEPSKKAAQTIVDHTMPDEAPWFILNSGMAGVLVAYEDRVLLIKVGALTSFAAGSMGGGRITSFALSEITGLEYNSGLMAGVLEILTPSYQGTKSQDYWKGSNKSFNADSSNPFAISNTLPLTRGEYRAALPHLNELRKRIHESKQTVVHVSAPTAQEPAGASLADELLKLATIRDQGVITDEEFTALKAGVMKRML